MSVSPDLPADASDRTSQSRHQEAIYASSVADARKVAFVAQVCAGIDRCRWQLQGARVAALVKQPQMGRVLRCGEREHFGRTGGRDGVGGFKLPVPRKHSSHGRRGRAMTPKLSHARGPTQRRWRQCRAASVRQPRAVVAAVLRALLDSRRNTSPKWLDAPGPDAEELGRFFAADASAPNHGRLTPWRFVIVPSDKRPLLANAFASALGGRDPSATLEQIEAARHKAYRAPLLMPAIVVNGDAEPVRNFVCEA